MRKVGYFIKKDFFVATSYKFQFCFQFINIFIYVATFYFLSKLIGDDYAREHLRVYGVNYFSFVLIGISFSNFVKVGLVNLTQNIRNSMVEGSLEAMLVSPTKPTFVIVASSIWQFIFESIRVILFLIVGALFFNAQFARPNALGALIVMVLTILAFGGLGIISASIIIVLKRGDPINWILQGLFSLLGGVLFPITVLPSWLRSISYMIPITYSLRAMRRALILGSPMGELWPDIAALAIFALIVFPISIFVCNAMLRRAKELGTLSTF